MINTLPEQAKRYALVIGVNNYEDLQVGDLSGANRDARALADALQQYAGFPHEQIFLLTTDQFDKDQRPTRRNILSRLDTLVNTVPEDGLLLVSFAGHGIEREERPFLLPADAPYTHNVNFLEDTAVSVARLKEYIKQTRVGQVIILLDACRNLLGAGRGSSPNPLTEAYRRSFKFDVRNHEVQAFATVYATAVGEFALEDIVRNRGYFTTAVVEAMAGAAANERGEVTLSALVKYVQEQVPHRVKLMGGGHEQKPFADIEGFKADDLVIAAVEPRAASVVVTPPNELERMFWSEIQKSDNPEDFEDYLKRWPQGVFARFASRRIEAIRRAEQQRQEELARQREEKAQRERERVQEAKPQRELEEGQRRAEAARLAEEQRQQEERQRLQEQARQREVEAEQQAQREREEAAQLAAEPRQQEPPSQRELEEKLRSEIEALSEAARIQSGYRTNLIIGLVIVAILTGTSVYWFWFRDRGSQEPIGVEITKPSGLKYVNLVDGKGASPVPGNTVTVHYTGALENGTKFDSSVDRGQPFTFTIGVGQVIKGFDEGVMSMRVGGKRKLIIPGTMGYGPAGSPPGIPPNATMLFDVELLDVK